MKKLFLLTLAVGFVIMYSCGNNEDILEGSSKPTPKDISAKHRSIEDASQVAQADNSQCATDAVSYNRFKYFGMYL